MLGGIGTWTLVSSKLADQNITTAEDSWLPNREVRGPLTAYAQADIIEEHALEGTGGQTFAELDGDDPLRDTAMNASFLQASLFTSVLAFGVAAMAIGMGLLFVQLRLRRLHTYPRRCPTGLAAGTPYGLRASSCPRSAPPRPWHTAAGHDQREDGSRRR